MAEKSYKYESELSGRLNLENQYLKNQLKDCGKRVEEKEKIISKLNKQVLDLNMTIDKISMEHSAREKELVEQIREFELLIDPPAEEKKSVFTQALCSVGIKVSEY